MWKAQTLSAHASSSWTISFGSSSKVWEATMSTHSRGDVLWRITWLTCSCPFFAPTRGTLRGHEPHRMVSQCHCRSRSSLWKWWTWAWEASLVHNREWLVDVPLYMSSVVALVFAPSWCRGTCACWRSRHGTIILIACVYSPRVVVMKFLRLRRMSIHVCFTLPIHHGTRSNSKWLKEWIISSYLLYSFDEKDRRSSNVYQLLRWYVFPTHTYMLPTRPR